MTVRILVAALFPAALAAASCGSAQSGDSAATPAAPPASGAAAVARGEPVDLPGEAPFAVTAHGAFDEPWAIAFAPGTSTLFITERPGTLKFVDLPSGRTGTVSGVPHVDHGGQGGLGDVAFLPSEASPTLDRRTIYLTWAEAGQGDTRGAVLGRGTLLCGDAAACRIEGLSVIWRQQPKVTGRGHYSHRIAIAPDGQHLFLASGDRQKMEPAQDLANNLGAVLRLNLDGTPAAGNPFAERGGVSREIWSYGHRNILGLEFDPQGRLWALEHGPRGGDELNLIERGANYGWPLVSEGVHYDGRPIPDPDTRPDLAQAAIGWTPVIAPGGFLFYSGELWPQWRGVALLTGLLSQALIPVAIDGTQGRELARYRFPRRLRDIAEAPDGTLWLIEDEEGGRLLRLAPL
ncbi:MAG: PQQ-dependent sugar dehydrogenase [Porphyrobacter sp.]|nr:PQQ-dependent sugar dehydrogenase [Porphyrobacter sp.]